jgi:hypothetical protein
VVLIGVGDETYFIWQKYCLGCFLKLGDNEFFEGRKTNFQKTLWLGSFPVLYGDTCLVKNLFGQTEADVAFMGIGDTNH